MENKRLPVGIDDFADIRKNDFYYIDKTRMIKDLLNNWGSVNLFARPRRFGKSLNMSMLKHFFQIGTDKTMFDGLEISKETALCDEYMGKFPVISLSLKQVSGFDFETAQEEMWTIIKAEAERFDYLQESTRLNDRDKKSMMDLSMGKGNLKESLALMSRILCREHGQKAIILIDEYDVPLQKAEERGYYRQMIELISQMFGYGMKSNVNMKFAVVTGCLRIAKESIFTGFNNPKIHTIADERYDEWFGFTDAEVRKILSDYDRSEYYEITKEWYDGYLFGKTHVYCPWDVINWCDKLLHESIRVPENFWAHTSGNAIIRRFADMADQATREQLGELIEGKSIWKNLNLDLTYDELDSSIENLWSVMFMTGYLTQKGRNEDGDFELVIPNREVNKLFKDIAEKWFTEKVFADKEGLEDFFGALQEHDPERLEACINYTLEESISFFDGGKVSEKENFYHGLMLGMLKYRTGWMTLSNREAGKGRLDIVTFPRRGKDAIIFEFKYVREEKELEDAAKAALKQIAENNYDKYFGFRKPEKIVHYGIAFCKKQCKVLMNQTYEINSRKAAIED